MRRIRRAIVFVTVTVFAASFAALAAHVAIDVVGNWLLVHDAYDDVPHASRGAACIAAAVFALAAMIARVADTREESVAHILARVSPLPFLVAVVASTAALVLAMEAADASSAHAALRDFDDLFGGSIALGLAVVGVCAGIAAAVTVRLARFFDVLPDAVAAALTLFVRRPRAVPVALSRSALVAVPVPAGVRNARRRPMRAPPRPLRVSVF